MRIDAMGLHYRELNQQIRTAVEAGETDFELDNVCGHRYIGCGLDAPVDIRIHGIPGNDLASFMSGPRVWCSGNAQDAIANTMSDGLVVVPGMREMCWATRCAGARCTCGAMPATASGFT